MSPMESRDGKGSGEMSADHNVQPPTPEEDPNEQECEAELWSNFENRERIPGEGIAKYVERFGEAYDAVIAICVMKLPTEIRAQAKLKRPVLEEEVHGIAMPELNPMEKTTLYEQVKVLIREMVDEHPEIRQEAGIPARVRRQPVSEIASGSEEDDEECSSGRKDGDHGEYNRGETLI